VSGQFPGVGNGDHARIAKLPDGGSGRADRIYPVRQMSFCGAEQPVMQFLDDPVPKPAGS